MRAEQHDPVGREQRGSLGVEVLVGRDIEGEALPVEPVDEVHLGAEMPARAAPVGGELGAQVEHRLQAGDRAAIAAVGVRIVGRGAELRTEAGREGILAREHHRMVARQIPLDEVLHMKALVGVGHVGEGGEQEEDIRARCAGPRPHEERDVVLFVLRAPEPRSVDAARQVAGHLVHEVCLPARIVDIVVMEVDRRVMLGIRREA